MDRRKFIDLTGRLIAGTAIGGPLMISTQYAVAGIPLGTVVVFLGEILVGEILLGFLKGAFGIDVHTWIVSKFRGEGKQRLYFPQSYRPTEISNISRMRKVHLSDFNMDFCKCGCNKNCCYMSLSSSSGLWLGKSWNNTIKVPKEHVAVMANYANSEKGKYHCMTRVLGAPIDVAYEYYSCPCHHNQSPCTCQNGSCNGKCGCKHERISWQQFENGTLRCVLDFAVKNPTHYTGEFYKNWYKQSKFDKPRNRPSHASEYILV